MDKLNRFWRRIRPSDATRIVAWATAIQTVCVVGTLIYAARTLDDSNRIAWRTFLDTRATALDRLIIDREALRCVYRYGLKRIDTDCPDKVYDRANLSQAVEYVSQQIGILYEARQYSDTEDREYYDDWYRDYADQLSADPTGIVSFVLWDQYDCTSADKCDMARDLKICIAGANNIVDQKEGRDYNRCFKNLEAKRKRFLEAVGERDEAGQ